MRRDREINIFNIAFLDVITGALGAFILLTVLLVAQAKRSGGGADPAELERLKRENQQLRQSQNQQSQSAKQENEDLRPRLEWNIARASLVVHASWNCSGAELRSYVWHPRREDPGQPPLFDPGQREQEPYFNGDQHYKLGPSASGISEDIWIDTWIHPKETRRIFYALQSPLSLKTTCAVSIAFMASGPSDPVVPSGPSTVLNGREVGMAPVALSAARPWTFAGELEFGEVVSKRRQIKVNPTAELLPGERSNIDRWMERTRTERGQ
jgi:hypothetical protein